MLAVVSDQEGLEAGSGCLPVDAIYYITLQVEPVDKGARGKSLTQLIEV